MTEFIVIVVIFIASAVWNAITKKMQQNGEQPDLPEPWPQTPTRPQRPLPPPPVVEERTVPQPPRWEEELRKLLEGSFPTSEPSSPPPPPVVRHPQPLPPPVPPPHSPYVPATRTGRSSLIRAKTEETLLEELECTNEHLARLSQSRPEHTRGRQMDQSVRDHMEGILSHQLGTGVREHRTASPEIQAAVAMLRSRATARQALILTTILGEPKSA